MSYLIATEQDVAEYTELYNDGQFELGSNVQRVKSETQAVWFLLPVDALKYVRAALDEGRVDGSFYVDSETLEPEQLPCGCIKGLGAVAIVGQDAALEAHNTQDYGEELWYSAALGRFGVETNCNYTEERLVAELNVGDTPADSDLAALVARWLDEVIAAKETYVQNAGE